MIRVLHVIGAMDRAGAETMIMNLYRHIDRTQVQFDFLVHADRVCDFDEEIEALGGRIYHINRFVGPNYVSYKRACRRFFKDHPEHCVVHGHIGSSANLYLDEAKRAGRYTIAHSHAQHFIPGILGLAFRVLSRTSPRITDHYFACSDEAGIDRFGEEVVKSDRYTLLNNGIDVDLYRTDEASHVQAKEALGLRTRPVIVQVGRLVEVKNHCFSFDVMERVVKTEPQACLLLAGRGELEAELIKEVARRGLNDHVKFLGVCDNVSDILRASDAYLMPSIKEGLAISAIEAQASGLPSFLSTGIPEQAVVSSHAYRLDLSDGADVWAQALCEALEQARHTPRADACACVRAHGFDVAQTAVRLQAFYLEAARNNAAL